jgi:hypothetical protein
VVTCGDQYGKGEVAICTWRTSQHPSIWGGRACMISISFYIILYLFNIYLRFFPLQGDTKRATLRPCHVGSISCGQSCGAFPRDFIWKCGIYPHFGHLDIQLREFYDKY